MLSGSESEDTGLFKAFPAMLNLTAGATLADGRYEIIRPLDQGNISAVFLASDSQEEKEVALKLLHSSVAKDRHTLNTLRKEMERVSLLKHPNIMRFFNLEEDGDFLFLVVEYVKGVSLQQQLREEGTLPEETVLEILPQICAGLEYAHMQNIQHCDIRPSNLMITEDGTVKICDFILSRIIIDSMTHLTGVQKTNILRYMSPEQLRGKRLDRRSDIYSLGVVLYEMLSGRAPFSTGDVTYQILNEPPTPLHEISPQLSSTIMKCLAKSSAGRWPQATNLLWMHQEQSELISEVPAHPVDSSSSQVPAPPPAPTQQYSDPAIPPPPPDRPPELEEDDEAEEPEIDQDKAKLVEKEYPSSNAFDEDDYLYGDKTKKPAPEKEEESEKEEQESEWKAPPDKDVGGHSNLSNEEIDALNLHGPAPRKVSRRSFYLKTAITVAVIAAAVVWGLFYYDDGSLGKRITSVDVFAGILKDNPPTKSKWTPLPVPVLDPVVDELAIDWREDGDTGWLHVSIDSTSREVTIEFIKAPQGEFWMGAAEGEEANENLAIRRQISIPRDFWISRYEITQEQWDVVMPEEWDPITGKPVKRLRNKNIPVRGVSWFECQEFIGRLNERYYRLPNEAEWEYACRAGSNDMYNFGNDAARLVDSAYFGNKVKSPMQVGSKAANAWGLFDMHGNLKEWCQDLFNPADQEGRRVIRGGSWHSSAWQCRCAWREGENPRVGNDLIGFRLVRDI
jgi:serine/threonine protein kinase